jgi:hypothetical protein
VLDELTGTDVEAAPKKKPDVVSSPAVVIILTTYPKLSGVLVGSDPLQDCITMCYGGGLW